MSRLRHKKASPLVASPAISRCAGVVVVRGATCTVLGAGVVFGDVDRDDKGAFVHKPRANARTATTIASPPSPVHPRACHLPR